jgi:hypothetical protein
LKPFHKLTLLITFLLLSLFSTANAQTTGMTFAAVRDDALWVSLNGAEPVMVSQGKFGSIDWSSDGTKLAFIRYNEDYSSRLLVAHIGSLTSPVEIHITGSLETGMPATFILDDQLLFAQKPAEPSTSAERQTEIYTIGLENGDVPQFVAAVDYRAGCGDNRTIVESDPGNLLTLEWTLAGIVYSTHCRGEGTALLHPATGESVEIGTALTGVRLSPLRTQIAGIVPVHKGSKDATIQIIDLATMTLREEEMLAYPKQLAWGAEDVLLYSTRSRDGNLLDGLTEAEISTLYFAMQVPPPASTAYANVPHFKVVLRRYHLTTEEDIILYTGDGSAMNNLTMLDEEHLVFSQRPNSNAWVDSVLAGTLNPQAAEYMQQVEALLPPELFILNLSDNSVESAGTGLTQYTPYAAR